MNDNKIGYVTQRTTKAKLIELICAVLVIAMWVMMVVGFIQEKKLGALMLLEAFLGTMGTGMMLYLAYCPNTFNLPKQPKAEHYTLTVWLLRVMALISALLIVLVDLTLLGLTGKQTIQWLIFTLIGVMVSITVWYVVKMKRIS